MKLQQKPFLPKEFLDARNEGDGAGLRDDLLQQGVDQLRPEVSKICNEITVDINNTLDLFLREKSKGYATVLILGGVSEAMDAGLQDIRLTMKKRKGFVKYAMQVRRQDTTYGAKFKSRSLHLCSTGAPSCPPSPLARTFYMIIPWIPTD